MFAAHTKGAVAHRLAIHTGPQLARSAAFSFAGQALPLVVAVATLPVIIDGLGTDRFGAFQLAWVVLGYVALADLGLGRATTRFVAEQLGRGDRNTISTIVASAALFQILIGVLAGAALAGMAPVLVTHVFQVPASLTQEVTHSFYLLAAVVPIVLLSTSFSGVLQAVQRFDLVSLVQGASAVATYVLPVIALAFGAGLVGVVGLVVAARVVALAAFIALTWQVVPEIRGVPRPKRGMLGSLIAFGGWVTTTNVLASVMVYLDRFLIGARLGLGSVAYYAAPYDVVTRLGVIPGSIVPPLFAAFSALEGPGNVPRRREIFLAAAKYLVILLAPIALAGMLVAAPAMGWWLGDEFAVRSTAVTQILLIAIAANGIAQLGAAAIQAVGRADLTAKFHAVELPVYCVTLWALLPRYGIAGAAVAWLVRALIDAIMLYTAALRVNGISIGQFGRRVLLPCLPPLLGFAAVAGLITTLSDGPWGRLAAAVAAGLVFAALAWGFTLDKHERRPLLAMVTSRSAAKEPPR